MMKFAGSADSARARATKLSTNVSTVDQEVQPLRKLVRRQCARGIALQACKSEQ